MASCSIGLDDAHERCSEPDDDVETKAAAHWNTNPRPSDDRRELPHASNRKYDSDFDMGIVDQLWLRECLFAPTFPPLDVSHPNSPRRK